MTLSASVEVMQARRDEMPERAQAALDLLVGRRRPLPGPGRGPARDLPVRRRRDPPAPRGAAASPSSSARPSRSAACPTDRRSTSASAAEMVIVNGDRRRLARVVANLIDNARAARRRRASTVDVIEPDDEGEPLGHVWIVVEDHGPGVPLEERDWCSSASPAGRRPAGAAAATGPGSGSPSSTSTSACTAAGSGSRTAPTASPVPASCIELPAEEVGRSDAPVRPLLRSIAMPSRCSVAGCGIAHRRRARATSPATPGAARRRRTRRQRHRRRRRADLPRRRRRAGRVLRSSPATSTRSPRRCCQALLARPDPSRARRPICARRSRPSTELLGRPP